MNNNFSHIKKICFTGLMIAIAILVNMFSITMPVAGAPVMRISFSGVFLRLVAIFCGSFYSAASGGITDILSHLIKPQGAYLWPLTLVAVCKGFTIGYLWRYMAQINPKNFKIFYLSVFILLAAFGFMNYILLYLYPNSAYSLFISLIGKKTNYVSIGILIASFIGIFSYAIAFFIEKKGKNKNFLVLYLKLIVATGIPSIIFTSINTIILQKYFLLPEKAFILIWLPRATEEIILVLLNSYLLIFIVNIFNKRRMV